jgi:hypothetical protein
LDMFSFKPSEFSGWVFIRRPWPLFCLIRSDIPSLIAYTSLIRRELISEAQK